VPKALIFCGIIENHIDNMKATTSVQKPEQNRLKIYHYDIRDKK